MRFILWISVVHHRKTDQWRDILRITARIDSTKIALWVRHAYLIHILLTHELWIHAACSRLRAPCLIIRTSKGSYFHCSIAVIIFLSCTLLCYVRHLWRTGLFNNRWLMSSRWPISWINKLSNNTASWKWREWFSAIRNEVSVWFNLRYNCSRWSLNRFTSLSYPRYFLIKDKETIELLLRACSTWQTESGKVVKRLMLVKPRWDSSWTDASRISRSVFKDREKGHTEISRHFFPHLDFLVSHRLILSRAMRTRAVQTLTVTTYCPEGQLGSRAKLSLGFYCVALLTRPRERVTRRELITLCSLLELVLFQQNIINTIIMR